MAEYVGSRPRGGGRGIHRSIASLYHPPVAHAAPAPPPQPQPQIRSESTSPYPTDFRGILDLTIERGSPELQRHARALADRLDRTMLGQPDSLGGFMATMVRNAHAQMISTGGVVGINDYGVKGRRQYAAERRRLLDLYVIVLNNADIRTATIHLRNEIFRRGIELVPAFDFKCPQCETEYSKQEAKEANYICPDPACGGAQMRQPDKNQIKYFRKLAKRCNYFGQSFETLLRSTEDDINIVDDAFLYMRNEYTIDELTFRRAVSDPFNDTYAPKVHVKQMFRLDPTLVELDLDARGLPGMAHHACIFHRDVLLDVPFDENWDVEWQGICPQCGLRTYPIYYKYSEQQAGSFGARRPEVLYLFDNEVVHWQKFSPSETYGFPPVLSFYEKALTLIGMDRYLYDYFYERRVPQGIIAAYTDDADGLERQKEDIEAKMQRDPHYIPWIAVSAKTQQGKIEFVRFAYSLDELNYLPVRDEIRERIAAMFGVSQLWMSSTEGLGGLSSESQQLVVMSRAVEGGQRIYNSTVFPKIMEALGVTDWYAELKTPELTAELTAVQIKQVRATLAQTMIGSGFGARYDPEKQDFDYWGEVPSQQEQQQEQQQVAGQNPYNAQAVQNAVLRKAQFDRIRSDLRQLAALREYERGRRQPA